MGLLAWYPLIKDTENYGIDGQNLEVKGEITYTEGKIGESATFVGNTANCLYRNGFKLEDNFTWCAWIKITNNNVQQYLLSEGRDYGLRGFNIYCSTAPALRAIWGGQDTGQDLLILPTMELNTWYHIGITVNSEQGIKAYVNGEFIKEGLYSKPDYTYSNNKFVIGKMAYSYSDDNHWFPTSGQIQDVRIYNETLSPMQIKLISQGLVAHYLLNNNGSGLPNYFRNSNLSTGTTTGWNGVNGSTISIEEIDNKKTITATKGTTNYLIDQSISDYEYVANTDVSFVISADVYVTETGTLGIGQWISSSEVSGWQNMTGTGTFLTPNTLSLGWNHVIYKATKRNSHNGSVIVSFGYTGTTAYFTNLKFEFSDKPTPWCPNSTDSIYIQLGYNNNIEYDVSGYCNNGTKYNITDYTSDTPRYSVATKFNGTNSYINVGRGGMVRDEITVNIWGYMDDWTKYNSRLISCTEGGGWNFEPVSGKIHFAIGTGSTSNTYKNTSGYTLSELSSGWHMFTGTYDGFTTKQYIDGVLNSSNNAYTTKTPIYYNNSNSIFIGAEATGSSTSAGGAYFNGLISDVRIYGTALSESDIQSLYNNSAFIDSSGNVYSTEYIEE